MASEYSPERGTKRRKISTEESKPQHNGGLEVTSHKQLHDLLYFRQNAKLEALRGLNAFKDFLSSIQQSEIEAEKEKKFHILKTYCDTQIPKVEDGVCLSDLLQTWNFAESSHQENILVIAPSVLAQLLKTISTRLEFREFGGSLCKTLMQKEQLRLINHSLSAPKIKEHLISPCIRLLTEVVSFDGGANARSVYLHRDTTYKRLEHFLTPNKNQIEAISATSKKSTLRRNTQRYVLANMLFLQGAAKVDFLEQHKIIRALLEFIRRDPRELVLEILKTIDRNVAHDSTIPRITKSRFFNKWNMERMVTLYGYEKDRKDEDPDNRVPAEIHRMLLQICTVPEMGVLLPQNGWYPPSSDSSVELTRDDDYIDLGLDAPFYQDKYKESVPVRNGTLSALVQVLRPESDTLQMELLLAIFKAAPELVADFFTKRSMFNAEPKATQTWMGESAFLFSVVQLAVPPKFGRKEHMSELPPPVSIAVENILPRPLNAKILTRCFTQNSDSIVTLFAVRIVTAALRKLHKVLKEYEDNHGHHQILWEQAEAKLTAEFVARCPSVREAVLLFRRTPPEDLQQQAAVMELIAAYYDVIPSIATEEAFDVALIIVKVLERLNDSNISDEDSEAALTLLQNTLLIAHRSTSMRWWQQPASFSFSALTCILRVALTTNDQSSAKTLSTLIGSVLVDHAILANVTGSFDALMASLKGHDAADLDVQLQFLDNCLCRIAKRPVHYQDLSTKVVDDSTSHLSLLVVAVLEQWPFVLKSNDAVREDSVARWVASLIKNLKSFGENKRALKTVRDSLCDISEKKKTKHLFKKALKAGEDMGDAEDDHGSKRAESPNQEIPVEANNVTAKLLDVFGALPPAKTDHTELYKWEKEEVDIAIEQGRVGDLLLCLCSEHEEIRRQAFAAISRLMAKLKDSKYSEWRAVYLLLGEVRETVHQIGFESRLPTIARQLSVACLTVLNDPLHKMYGKVNRYLQRRPWWETEKIPSYWIDQILLHPPEDDEGHTEEVNWLLDLLVNGLQTPQDLNIYRRTNVFEHILSLYNAPSSTVPMKKKILNILFRGAQVGGGTTLITRAAALSWIESCSVTSDAFSNLWKKLARAIYESSDHERVDNWSGHSISAVLTAGSS